MTANTDWYEKLESIFIQGFISHPVEENGRHSLTLAENAPDAKLKAITISNVPERTILLNLQKYSALNAGSLMNRIIKGGHGVFRCCDYLLVSESNERVDFIYIEMKSKNAERSEVTEQFRGAICFMEYCKAIAEHFFDAPIPKGMHPTTSYALLSWMNINKTPTGSGRTKKNKYRKSLSPGEYIYRRIGSSGTIPFCWFTTTSPSQHFGR